MLKLYIGRFLFVIFSLSALALSPRAHAAKVQKKWKTSALPSLPSPEEIEAKPPARYNSFILNQAGALFHSYNDPATSLLIFASAVPLSRLLAPSGGEASPFSLIIDVNLKNLSQRTLLGLEYVF
jgi:hypothetical protein